MIFSFRSSLKYIFQNKSKLEKERLKKKDEEHDTRDAKWKKNYENMERPEDF
jgi:hypothetical protein